MPDIDKKDTRLMLKISTFLEKIITATIECLHFLNTEYLIMRSALVLDLSAIACRMFSNIEELRKVLGKFGGEEFFFEAQKDALTKCSEDSKISLLGSLAGFRFLFRSDIRNVQGIIKEVNFQNTGDFFCQTFRLYPKLNHESMLIRIDDKDHAFYFEYSSSNPNWRLYYGDNRDQVIEGTLTIRYFPNS